MKIIFLIISIITAVPLTQAASDHDKVGSFDFGVGKSNLGYLTCSPKHPINVLGSVNILRSLHGEGFHRLLVTTIQYDVSLDVISWLEDHFCEMLIIEALPSSVFADTFEIQHLVGLKAFLDVVVSGDTNLELPSFLSNQSIVKIHVDLDAAINLQGHKITTKLPLHGRYPALRGSGYSRIELETPDFFVHCKPKNMDVVSCNGTTDKISIVEPAESVIWTVPCGNMDHVKLVSSFTFVAALVSASSIIYSSISYKNVGGL